MNILYSVNSSVMDDENSEKVHEVNVGRRYQAPLLSG